MTAFQTQFYKNKFDKDVRKRSSMDGSLGQGWPISFFEAHGPDSSKVGESQY
jgi:hypothetical protein